MSALKVVYKLYLVSLNQWSYCQTMQQCRLCFSLRFCTNYPTDQYQFTAQRLGAAGTPLYFFSHVMFFSANPKEKGNNLVRFCSRCSRGYVCPTEMRVPPWGSFWTGGERSVRGGLTGGVGHLSPHLCPPHYSGPTGRPLRDRGRVLPSRLWPTALPRPFVLSQTCTCS